MYANSNIMKISMRSNFLWNKIIASHKALLNLYTEIKPRLNLILVFFGLKMKGIGVQGNKMK